MASKQGYNQSHNRLLTQVEYARSRGLSQQAVSKAVKAGRIPTTRGKIDPEKADAAWRENTRPRVDLHGNGDGEGGPDLAARERPQATFLAARALREVYNAKRAKAEFEQFEGNLVPAEEVRALAFKTARAMRDRLLGIPARLAPVIFAAKDVAECHRILEEALLEACQGLGASGDTPGSEEGA